jgi:hypothetical protein
MSSNTETVKKLKAYYDAFVAQEKILAELTKDSIVNDTDFAFVETQIQKARADFPSVIPPFDASQFGMTRDYRFYSRAGLRSYLATCAANLKAALVETESSPLMEHLEFRFVKDSGLREIIERDYGDIVKAVATTSWKSVIILSGGIIEAILLNCLMADESRARTAKGAPGGKPDLSEWDLSELLRVAVNLKMVEPSAEMLADAARQYRNIVHPGYELRNKLQVGKFEADSALNTLKILHRDLS